MDGSTQCAASAGVVVVLHHGVVAQVEHTAVRDLEDGSIGPQRVNRVVVRLRLITAHHATIEYHIVSRQYAVRTHVDHRATVGTFSSRKFVVMTFIAHHGNVIVVQSTQRLIVSDVQLVENTQHVARLIDSV